MMKRIVKKREGYALIIVLLGLALMSIFGIVIIGITTSNFKMTKVDSQSQGAYYIAEAGMNKMIDDISKKVDGLSGIELSHDDFFRDLDMHIDQTLADPLEGFTKNFGKSPLAQIKIEKKTIDEAGSLGNPNKRIVNYVFSSIGTINNSNRKVIASIKVTHEISGVHPAFKHTLYSGSQTNYNKPTNTVIKGSVYGSDLNFGATSIVVEGDIISESDVSLSSSVKVTGDIYAMNGGVNLASSSNNMTGDINATGDVRLTYGTVVDGNIYTNGNVIFGGNNTITGDINAAMNVGTNTEGTHVKVKGDIISGMKVIARADETYVFSKGVYAADEIANGNGNKILGEAVSAQKITNYGTIGKVYAPIIDNHGTIINNTDPSEVKSPRVVMPPSFDGLKIEDSGVPTTVFNSGDVNIVSTGNATKHTIAPGYYGDVTLSYQDTVDLKSGNYYFNSIKGNLNSLKLKIDISKGPIKIHLKEDMKFSDNLEVHVSQDGNNYIKIDEKFIKKNNDLAIDLAKMIYWETHKSFQLPQGCSFLGSVLAENSFTAGYKNTLVGAYVVNKGTLTIKENSMIIHAHPPGGADDGGINDTDQKDRVKIIKAIREQ